MTTEEHMAPDAFADLVNELGNEFFQMCADRHQKGKVTYGEFTFLETDTFQMLFEEFADATNYMTYLYVKTRLLQMMLANDPRLERFTNEAGEVRFGAGGFFHGGIDDKPQR